MRGRGQGLAAAAGLLATVVGVPMVVTVLNGPPPSSIPSWSEAVRALGQPITDAAILRGVAIIAWAVWLLFCAAVALEAIAVARHRPGPSATRRGLRVPGLQGVAGTLVLATTLALFNRPPPTALLGAAPVRNPPASATVSGPAPPDTVTDLPALRAAAVAPTTIAPVAAPATVAAISPPWVPYTVVRYDSPWAIAERHLGNGLRWREIRDETGASLIAGPDADDGPTAAGTETTARIIYPGQVLLLPPQATGVPVTPPDPQPPAPQPTDPQPPAPQPTDPQPPAPQPPAPPVTTVWTGSVTTAAEQVPAGPPAARVTTSGMASTTTGRSPIVPLSELLLGAGFVASAVVNVLGVRRSRQAGRARSGERVPLPDLALRRTELALRRGTNDGLVTATHRAMTALASDLGRAGQSAPLISGVLAGEDAIDVLLAHPSAPPPPWHATADGRQWRMAVTDIPSGAGCRHPDLLPGLLPIGHETVTGSEVLINLEASAVTGVTGPPEMAAGLVHGAALALTGLPWARSADVILIGFGHLLATAQPHMRVAASLATIGDELRSVAAASATRLQVIGAAHIAAGRLEEGSDGLAPTIIVAADPPSTDEVALLAEVCRHDTSITALVAGDIAAPRMLRTETNPFYVPDLRIAVSPSVLPGSELTAVNQILNVALTGSGAGPDEPPYQDLVSGERDRAAEPDSRPDRPVVIQVLGPVEIDDCGEFRRPHAREVAVYLAMHPRGVAEHQLDEAIWPERHLVKATTRDPVVSSARTALGGPERMRHAQGQGPDKRYRVTDQVGTDWQRFCLLHAAGRRSREISPLREALELVRDRPFADVVAGPGYGWLHLEGHLHHMEAEIVDAADLTAELYLAEGDPVAARWAANQGLRAGPYAERLWVRLMAVADALGEAQEVERILVEMDRRLDLEGDYDQLHPGTLDAYRRYSRRSQRPRAG